LVYWQVDSQKAMSDRIIELGLDDCRVCGATESNSTWQQPALIHVGGHVDDHPDANMCYAIIVLCRQCGYMMLFDSERFSRGDEYTLTAHRPHVVG
jgi:hypothetical protein